MNKQSSKSKTDFPLCSSLDYRIGDKVPDEKTIWLFKEQLKEKKLAEDLFNLFAGQLLGQGIVAKEGSLSRTLVSGVLMICFSLVSMVLNSFMFYDSVKF